jgi:hypothetical protein
MTLILTWIESLHQTRHGTSPGRPQRSAGNGVRTHVHNRRRFDIAGLAAYIVSWTYIGFASAGRVPACLPVSQAETVASVAPSLRACAGRAKLVREVEHYLSLDAP